MTVKERKRQMKRKIARMMRLGMMLLVVILAGVFVWKIIGNMKRASEEKQKAKEAAVEQEMRRQEEEEARKEEEKKQEMQETLDELSVQINTLLEEVSGTWSVYVQDLETGAELVINNREMYAASLSKIFVMESVYAHIDEIVANEKARTGTDDRSVNSEKVQEYLENMITISDNESYNELIRLHSSTLDFTEACEKVDDYLQQQEYRDTGVYHTLAPSNSAYLYISDIYNHTTVKDCGKILESIYKKECVSEEASEEMLDLLLAQERKAKIPSGVPKGIKVANKTGETDESQHDVAIVFGEERDYILCVMSYNPSSSAASVNMIGQISSAVYDALK